MKIVNLYLLALCFILPLTIFAQEKQLDLNTFKWRSIGPSFMSGRIIDVEVDRTDPSTYYVGVASGGVFKTTNNGTTYQPIFDSYGSYAIGCITIDPNNRNIVWIGTGEANNQRSVGYGDGIYKSEDGGKNFKNMGLTTSNHIGAIVVDPHNSDIIFVAAYGPLWESGGERGVYKSEDGGNSWRRILEISIHTGIADLVMDPHNNKILYASAHQRQRKGYGYISGGPESSLYRTTDGGAHWTPINNGLPSVDKGRIAIAISPLNSDVLYCHLEAAEDKGGSYKSKDRGASWEKMSDYASSGLYYGKIFTDPVQFDKLYVGDVYPKVSIDGGKTFTKLPLKNVHVDNHYIWVDPYNNKHLIMGGDGGLYETYNEGENWEFKENLSITQFYRVSTDNSEPFYNVYGGTQDNSSMGGPSRTTNVAGIPNSEWYITNGGDGFETQVDWTNPNILYAQAQHGWLVRHDKASGENVSIKPVELEGEPALRWNWDSPLLVSKYDAKRLYFGANKVYRSDDRGNSWKLISPDLSRQIDRNTLPYMGQIWSVDAVKKNTSTSIWGQTTTISESALDENLLYVGTDDGLIHITQDGGQHWQKIDHIPGIPKMSYIPQIICSMHDKDVAYVVFNHHRYGDYKPYLLQTRDGGKTWHLITNKLPERGSLYTIAEDHKDKNILFVGSDFGVFVSVDRGNSWQPLKNGLPTIAVKDIDIQRRENDLVIATFGRGIYILDNYSNIRDLAKDVGSNTAKIYPSKDAWIYEESNPLGGWGGNKYGTQGDRYASGDNPPYGVTVRYSVTDVPESIKSRRQKKEVELIKNKTLKGYPSLDSLLAEDHEVLPYHLLTIINESGDVIKRVRIYPSKGVQSYQWDLTGYDGFSINTNNNTGANRGIPVLPGKYKVQLYEMGQKDFILIAEGSYFEVKSLEWTSLPAKSLVEVHDFINEASEFAKVVYGTSDHVDWLKTKHQALSSGILSRPTSDISSLVTLTEISKKFTTIDLALNGNSSLETRQIEVLPGIKERLGHGLWAAYGHFSDIPQMRKDSYLLAVKQFGPVYEMVKDIEIQLNEIQAQAMKEGMPYIQGSLPEWDGK